MADKSPLRRWKPFFASFGAIDAAIEAASDGCSRDKYRQVRGDLVEMLCDAAGDDDEERAEGLCRLLDDAMVEALETLPVAPETATPIMLATTDVTKAVGDLRRHESGRVRVLARRVIGGWSACMSTFRAAWDKLAEIPHDEHDLAAPVTRRVRSDDDPEPGTLDLHEDQTKQDAKISDLELPKKMHPGVSTAGGDRVRNERSGDAKRKQSEEGGYCREADDVKRQCKISEKVEHRPRKMQPDVKCRSRVSGWRSTDERRFSTSLRHRV